MATKYDELSNDQLLRLAEAKIKNSSGRYNHELMVAVQELATLKSPRQALITYLLCDDAPKR